MNRSLKFGNKPALSCFAEIQWIKHILIVTQKNN